MREQDKNRERADWKREKRENGQTEAVNGRARPHTHSQEDSSLNSRLTCVGKRKEKQKEKKQKNEISEPQRENTGAPLIHWQKHSTMHISRGRDGWVHRVHATDSYKERCVSLI